MSNRLEELANSLGPAATRVRDRRRKPKRKGMATPGAPPAPPAATTSPAAAPGVQAYGRQLGLPPRLARAAAAVEYRVPGLVAPLAQPSSMTCWATVTTMMTMWREQATMTIDTALGRIGASYLAKYKGNLGLTTGEKAGFLAAAGLAYEYPKSLTASGWEGLLRSFGPIWVTTDEKPGAGFAIHARIIAGIHGDGSGDGTSLDIVDPNGGQTYSENFATFLGKYESEAMDPKRPLRIQIVHWPSDVAHHVARLHGGRAQAYAHSLAAARFATVDDAEFEPPYREGGDGHHAPSAHSAFAHGLKSATEMGAPDVRWAADADSIDYRHLATAIDTKPFDLTGELLDRLARFNRFTLPATNQRVVFGLRGCTLDADVATPTAKITVREVEPNHTDFRCVIGVWDRTANTIAAFQASTVPNWEYMEVYRENHGKKANMLPTGCYQLTVGTHRARMKNAAGALVDNPNRIQGALRNDQRVAVLRSEDDLTFTVRDTWDRTVPNDNIHPGIVAPNPGSSTVPDFSSAGCTTISGTSVSDAPAGAWAAFRGALGLNNANPRANDGQSFTYLLLTGREARLASTGNLTLGRLRFGSRGDDVRQLQEALARHPKKYYKGKVTSHFGSGTSMAFIRYQKDQGSGAADAIVSPADATALGFTLSSAAAAASGSKALDVIGTITDIAKGIFKKWTARPEEGRFSVESDIAEVLHEDTAASQQWQQKTAEFMLQATQPGVGKKDVARLNVQGGKTFHLKFRVSFEFNGHDLRAAQVQRLVQGSTGLINEKFSVKFVAKKGSAPNAESSKIDFIFNGKWDPGIGEKAFDFSGKLAVESDGFIDLDLDKNERVSVEFINNTTFGNVQVTKLAIPRVYKFFAVVLFEKPTQFDLSDKWKERIKSRLAKVKQENEVRYNRLRAGTIPITVEGYASPTGKEKMNRTLSAQRAKTVADFLRQELTSAAKVIEGAHSEPSPTTPAKEEVEDFLERRVEIRFEVPE